jgi:hypothetical protein
VDKVDYIFAQLFLKVDKVDYIFAPLFSKVEKVDPNPSQALHSV